MGTTVIGWICELCFLGLVVGVARRPALGAAVGAGAGAALFFLPPNAAISDNDSIPMPSRSEFFFCATAGKAATPSANATRTGERREGARG